MQQYSLFGHLATRFSAHPENLATERDAVFAALQWAFEQRHYHELFKIAKGVRYYHDIRGYWDRLKTIDLLSIDAACNAEEAQAEVEATASLVAKMCHQGNVTDAEKYLPRLIELSASLVLASDTYIEVQHAIFMYWRVQGNLDVAGQVCQEVLTREDLPAYTRIASRHWLAGCFYKKGRLDEAERLYEATLTEAKSYGYQRSIIFAQCRMITIHFDRGKNQQAEALLNEVVPIVYAYQDRRYMARVKLLQARLYRLRGDLSAARAALAEANDILERVGMRTELAEARDGLLRIEAEVAPII